MKKIFSFLAAVLFAGSMMAGTVQLTNANIVAAGDGESGYKAWAITDGASRTWNAYAIKNKHSNATADKHFLQIKKSDNSTAYYIQIPNLGENITSIKMIVSNTQKPMTDGANAATLFFSAANNTSAAGDGVVSGTGASEVVIDASSLELQTGYITAGAAVRVWEIEVTTTAVAPSAVAKPVIAGETPFKGSTSVNITCDTQGATIYYTLDGTDPTAESTEFTAAITLTETKTVKAIAIKGEDASEVASKTFTKMEPLTCAQVYSKSKNDAIYLNDVTVTYVNGKNVYVKDASGAMLLYLPADATWQAGDVLSGVEGTVDIYKNLYEVKPSDAQVAAVTATAGTAPEPIEFTAAPVAADMNKYIVMNNVSVAAGEFTTESATNLDLTIGDATVILRNSFKIAKTFVADKTYNVVGACAVFNDNVQVYFISAEEYVEPVVPADRRINAWGLNSVANGDDYNFTFYSNIAGNEASLLFYNNGTLVGRVKLDDAPVAGINEVTLSKADIPQGTGLTWAVELKANPVTEFAKVFDDTQHVLNRFHVNIDNSPESDYFGRVYGENRVKDGEGYIYVFNPDYSINQNKILAGQTKWQSAGRPWIDEDGTVLLADYGDDHGGVYIMNPSTLTTTGFYAGVQDMFKVDGVTPNGIWRNGTVEIGSSCVAAAVYGTGANKVLIATNEDAGTQLTKDGLTFYNIGQADGTVLRSWNQAPSRVMPLENNGGGNFSLAPCSHGIFLGQNRSIPASGTNNNSTAYSLMMYDYTGAKLFVSDNDHMPNLTANPGGGIALSADESKLAIIDQSSNIRLYSVAWNGNTPSLTLAATYPCGYAAAGTLAFDYAGNLLGSMGTAYGTSMRLVVYAMPTDKNEVIIPAKKALVVEGTDPNPTTAIEDIYVLEVQKVIRNGQVLIIKDGKTYNMMGQIVE